MTSRTSHDPAARKLQQRDRARGYGECDCRGDALEGCTAVYLYAPWGGRCLGPRLGIVAFYLTSLLWRRQMAAAPLLVRFDDHDHALGVLVVRAEVVVAVGVGDAEAGRGEQQLQLGHEDEAQLDL